MNTITGEYIKNKFFSNKVVIREKDGKEHEVRTTRYIMETLSYAFFKNKIISLAVDDKGKAFYMLPQTSTYLITSELEKKLKSKKNKELLSSGISSLFMAFLGSLLIFSGLLASISNFYQTGDFIFSCFFACSIISLPAFYMSKKIMEEYFNLRKILKNNYLLSKMTNHLNNYKTITLEKSVKIKENVKQ